MDIYNIELERDSLHRNLGGGFPKGSILIITGTDGAGKSAVSQRLLYGFLRNYHTVTYISTEMTTKGFIEQMKSLNYNIVDYLLSKDLLYIPVYPLIGRSRSREDFLARLMNTTQLYERDIIIIDTFSSLVKHDIDMDRTLKAMSFFKKISGKDKTIILTIDPDELPEDVMSYFLSDCDIYLDIQTRVIEGSTTRTIVVQRYTNAPAPIVEATGFRIEPKVGFIIDITTVA